MPSNDTTAVLKDGALRVDSIRNELEPWLVDRAREVFDVVRTSTSVEMFFFGRNVTVSDLGRCEDFAKRVNRLCEALDGTNIYRWLDGTIVCPKAVAILCTPLSVPLTMTPGNERKFMFLAYIFVEGLPVTAQSGDATSLLQTIGNYEERRLWLNTVVGKYLVAVQEGQIPINSEDLDAIDLSKR